MAVIEPHWVYQGRQAHGWFGSGTVPGKDITRGHPDAGDLFAPTSVGNRVDYAARSLFVHLHDRDAKHPTAQFEAATTENLKTAVAAWYGAKNLSRDAFRALLLNPSTNDSTVDRLRNAARRIVEARTSAVLNAGNASLGDAVRRIGLDNWPAYLADAAKRAVAAVDEKDIAGVIKVGAADMPASAPGVAALGLLMLYPYFGRSHAPKAPPAPSPPVIVHQDAPEDGGKSKEATPPQPANPGSSTVPQKGVVITPERRDYILNGKGRGGGHKYGTNKAGKAEFPQGWSDDKIMEEIKSVADDPASSRRIERGRIVIEGTREGIDIRVIVLPDETTVRSAYPTNTPRNPGKN
jgi:hypothetical protein